MTTQTRARRAPESTTPSPPRRPNLAQAARRYPVLILLPIVVLVAAGITLGDRRHPVYSASVQLNVGVTDANSQATPGYAEAAQELASSYSRQAVSRGTAATVARRTHLPVADVLDRVSSPAVPDSPTLYIDATGSTPAEAISLANTTAHVLQQNVDAQKQKTGAGPALAAYKRAQAHANALETTAGTLKARRQVSPTSVTAAQVSQAEVAAQVATLQAQALSEKYTSATNTSTDTNLEILSAATSASSDRKTYIERYGIIGLVAGLVIGAMLAFLLAILRTRFARPAG